MRRPALIVATTTVIVGCGVASWLAFGSPHLPAGAGNSRSVSDAAAPTADRQPGRVSESGIFVGWSQWSTPRRTATISGIMGDPRLPADTIAFLQQVLRDRTLDPGTRNNIANALMAQDERPAGLAETFLRMVDDPQESITWRDYSVQRLVLTLAPDADATPVAQKLLSIVRSGPGSLPGTALIQLDLLISSGRVVAGPAYAEALTQVATTATAPLENRMTAVAKIGERGDPAQVAVVRGLLTPQVEPALARVAIATLGLIGTPQDRPVVAKYLTHSNQSVVMAAKAAIKRLDARSAL